MSPRRPRHAPSCRAHVLVCRVGELTAAVADAPPRHPVEPTKRRLDAPKARGAERRLLLHYSSCNFSAAELMQYRCPVGCGPSGNTCPRWPPQFEHITSVRTIPKVVSVSSSIESSL